MYSTILTGTVWGVQACPVQVEVDVSPGLPMFSMVGSLRNEVRESKERVMAAFQNVGLEIPPMRITVNLSPADLKKDGTAFDLPIAAGLLEAFSFFRGGSLRDILLLGEIGLNGEVRRVKGVLPIVRAAAKEGVRECIVPCENLKEAGLIPGIVVRGISDIRQLLAFARAEGEGRDKILSPYQAPAPAGGEKEPAQTYDFSQISGQEAAKRAAEIAAAGFHNLLMTGPPGAGKTMIARSIPGILPPLSMEESLEVTAVYSVAGRLPESGIITERPFQSPHHTISSAALTGGGILPRPGVMSLSHRGVLFLGGYFCKTAETPNLRALWRFSYLEFFKKSAKTILHTTFWNCVLPLFGFSFAKMFMGVYTLMAKLYTIWQKKITKWRNYTRMAKGERAYGI